jgi:peptidoglycan/xylan/chitin deacetylase (PgdA/CDA1 family)
LKLGKYLDTIIPILFASFFMVILSVISNEYYLLLGFATTSIDGKKGEVKIVGFIFSDGLKSQITYAKPILDKYGFKATFDVICNNVGKKDGYMNWAEIKTLHDGGNDIGSHSMSHVRLTELSKKSIEYEVGNSKKCLQDYGINPVSFEYPFSEGSDNKTVVEIVAKYYQLATRGNDPLMFLRCDGMVQYDQKNCKTYTDNGTPTYANKYSIRNWSHDFEKVENSYSEDQALQRFIDVVNSQSKYNKEGIVKAIPLIMYHGIGQSKTDPITNVNLFQKEMKYIYDNNFKVITISQLGYDAKNNYLYLKQLGSQPEVPRTSIATTNVTTPTQVPTTSIATTNVTTPTQVPTTSIATTNVTTPIAAPGGNIVLEILNQLFGLKENNSTAH